MDSCQCFNVCDVEMTASSGQRVIVVAVDASDNAKDAFDCTLQCVVVLSASEVIT